MLDTISDFGGDGLVVAAGESLPFMSGWKASSEEIFTREELLDRWKITEQQFKALELPSIPLPDGSVLYAKAQLDEYFSKSLDLSKTCGNSNPIPEVVEEQKSIHELLESLSMEMREIRNALDNERCGRIVKEWYTVKEAASLTGFKEYTIRQACNTGRFLEDWKKKDIRTGRWRITHEAITSIQNHGLPSIR